jgi:hypothetical protein
MLANVPQPGSTEQRISNRMQQDIRIGVTQ